MATTNTYPILFFAITEPLSTAEQALYTQYKTTGVSNAVEEAQYKTLEAKAKLSIPLSLRYPLPIDGTIIPAHKVGHTTSMTKSMSVIGGEVKVTQNTNTTTINFESVNDTFSSIVIDLLMLLADFAFSKQVDLCPSISFFGESIIITDGYLVGVSSGVNSNSNKQVISLTIAREITTTTGTAQEVATSGTPSALW